jgi:hypothetical protein
MERLDGHSKTKGTLQSVFIFAMVCAVIMGLVAAVLYFLNQNNDVMPDANPGNPIENRPPPSH